MSAPPARLTAGLGSGAVLVLLGGAVGTLARHGVGTALPPVDGWPVGTLAVNLLGALALGWLLTRLAPPPGAPGREPVSSRRLRLLLGTGVLGGFTTYSAVAVETERLVATGRAVTAATYVVGSVVGGLLLALAGSRLAARGRPGAVGPEREEGPA